MNSDHISSYESLRSRDLNTPSDRSIEDAADARRADGLWVVKACKYIPDEPRTVL